MDRYLLRYLSVVTLLSVFAFSFLLALDVKRAFQKRATWIPGKAFLLGSLTIQLLAFVAVTNITLLQDSAQPGISLLQDSAQPWDYETWVACRLVIDTCQLNICVFLGYFITGMVGPRSADNLAAIAALVTGLYIPIKSFISHKSDDNQNEKHEPLFFDDFMSLLLFICSAYHILLLGCIIIAGITARRILRQRISAILSTDQSEEIQESKDKYERMSSSWNDFEDELFKPWIVARVSQPDYVIARSVLSSAAGLVVTFVVVMSILQSAIVLQYISMYNSLLPLFISLCVIALAGWFVICCRWYSSLLIRKRCFCFEDLWTRAVSDTIYMYDLQKWRPTSNFFLDMSLRRIVTLFRLHKLLYLLRVLQILVVLLSKFLGFFSEIVFGKILRQCHKHAWYLQDRIRPTLTRYRYKSYVPILERICMPGEDPSDLWNANQRAINRIALLLKEGRDNGSITNSLFTPFSMDWVDQSFQLVDKLQNAALPQVIEYFPYPEKRCRKMTVVPLTPFIIELHRPVKSDRVSNAFKAYNQVWDLLSFLDKSDDSLDRGTDEVSVAADKELARLRQLYARLSIVSEEPAREINIEMAKNLCKCPEAILKIKNVWGEIQGRAKQDTHTIDWLRIAPSYNQYKQCKVMETDLEIDNMNDLEEQSEVDIAEDLIAWAENSLRNVIASCVWMVPDMRPRIRRRQDMGSNLFGTEGTRSNGIMGATYKTELQRMDTPTKPRYPRVTLYPELFLSYLFNLVL